MLCERSAAQGVVWFPGLVAAEAVGQISVFIYDTAIVHLYTESLTKLPETWQPQGYKVITSQFCQLEVL